MLLLLLMLLLPLGFTFFTARFTENRVVKILTCYLLRFVCVFFLRCLFFLTLLQQKASVFLVECTKNTLLLLLFLCAPKVNLVRVCLSLVHRHVHLPVTCFVSCCCCLIDVGGVKKKNRSRTKLVCYFFSLAFLPPKR